MPDKHVDISLFGQQQAQLTGNYPSSLPVTYQTQTNTNTQFFHNKSPELPTNQHPSSIEMNQTMYKPSANPPPQDDYINPLSALSSVIPSYTNYAVPYGQSNSFLGNSHHYSQLLQQQQPQQTDWTSYPTSTGTPHSSSLLYASTQQSSSSARPSSPATSANPSQSFAPLTPENQSNQNQEHNMATSASSLYPSPFFMNQSSLGPTSLPSFNMHQQSTVVPSSILPPLASSYPFYAPPPSPTAKQHSSSTSNSKDYVNVATAASFNTSNESRLHAPMASSHEHHFQPPFLNNFQNNIQRPAILQPPGELFKHIPTESIGSSSAASNLPRPSGIPKRRPKNIAKKKRFKDASPKKTQSNGKFTALNRAFIYFINYCKKTQPFPHIPDSDSKIIEHVEILTKSYFIKFLNVLNFIEYPASENESTNKEDILDFKIELAFRGANLFCDVLGNKHTTPRPIDTTTDLSIINAAPHNIQQSAGSDKEQHACRFSYKIRIDFKIKIVNTETVNLDTFNGIMLDYFTNNLDLLKFKPFMGWNLFGLKVLDMNVVIECSDLNNR